VRPSHGRPLRRPRRVIFVVVVVVVVVFVFVKLIIVGWQSRVRSKVHVRLRRRRSLRLNLQLRLTHHPPPTNQPLHQVGSLPSLAAAPFVVEVGD
jgi:hypothetical protein